MFIVSNYLLAVIFCFITMLCWGSWGNTQKMAAKNWRYELFYWDYVIGMVLFAFLIALTMGSFGSEGRPFLSDITQVSARNFGSIVLGGVIFNASNILLSASTSIAGLAVAFPLGVGISLVLGTIVNYIGAPKGDPVTLFAGVALIVVAIICNGIASGKLQREQKADASKGIILAVVAGTLMAFFYRFVAAAMDLNNFAEPAEGMATPYTAIVIFSLGVLLSNFVFNTFVMKKPFVGDPVTYKEYFKGNTRTHLVGMLGGAIWCLGTAFSYIASGKAGAAVSYALGQGAPMIAAVWGVFIWKEFKGATKGIYALLALMFCLFVSGLGFIIVSGEEKIVDSRIEVILDTDANNELDDQHAIAYLLLNEDTFEVSGITINATRNGGDVTEHGREAERVIALVNKSDAGIPVVLGANGSFESIKENLHGQDYDGRSAVEFIIRQASQKSPDDKLTVIAVGKLTNVALALFAEPSIIANIRLVWLGANYPDPGETNLVNDIPAMNYVLSTDVEMEIALCSYHTPHGTDAVRITKSRAQEIFAGKGPRVESAVPGRHGGEFHCFGDYSVSLFEHIRYWDDIQSRALYDMAAVAIVKNGDWAEKVELPAPTMIDEKWVDQPENPRTVSMWMNFDKEQIINDFIQTLESNNRL